jgi:carbon-monoxide dehydrogenase medium subunit
MLLSRVAYARPTSVEEAVELLSEHDNARPIAGGQTLVNVMKLRFATPDVLVDIGGIEGLDQIAVRADGGVELGAMVTYDALEHDERLVEARPVIGRVASVIADQQVRNRGTIGGNLCSNDPTNHLPPLVVALGASMTIAGRDGERTVPAEDFFQGVYLTAVEPGEVLTRVTFPPPAVGEGAGFGSMTIGKEGTGIVNVAARVCVNGTIAEPRVVVGCVAAVPVRAPTMEAALEGSLPTEANVRLAAEGLGSGLDPPSDVHASAGYRCHLAEVMAVRATLAAIEEAIR